MALSYNFTFFILCCITTLFSLSIFSITTTYGVLYEEVAEGIAIKRAEKTAHLHFYFQDIVSGKNATVVKIAAPEEGMFGTTMMADDVLTEGPDRGSKPVGKAQGLYAMAAQHDLSLLMVMNFVFTEGNYNGSSISILGRNPIMNDVREMPIVGGNGLFRLARGYALAHTVWADMRTGDATVEYNAWTLLMAINVAFVEGFYFPQLQCPLTVLGRSPIIDNVRAMPIVGGNGLFRFALD